MARVWICVSKHGVAMRMHAVWPVRDLLARVPHPDTALLDIPLTLSR